MELEVGSWVESESSGPGRPEEGIGRAYVVAVEAIVGIGC